MYDLRKALQDLSDAIDNVETCAANTDSKDFFDDDLIKKIDFLTNREIGIRDHIYSQYSKHESDWAGEGYRSAAQALSYITHDSINNTKKSLSRTEFLDACPLVREAFKLGDINSEHVNHLTKFYEDKFYREDLFSDLELLLENAKVLTAHRFSCALKHWKYMIQDLREKDDGTLKRYHQRRLSLWQTSVGDWILEGFLDPLSGELLNKSIESINNRIYKDSSKEQREEFEIQQASVDALAYLAQGYLTNNTQAIASSSQNDDNGKTELKTYNYASPLSADITIDIEQLTSSKTTREFLQESLEGKTPLACAHNKNLIKQMLCDATATFPVSDLNNNINLGRKVRLAPLRMKKQLSLLNNYCEVQGCSVPAKWCDAHHVKHWIYGGETKIENLALLCKRHHSLVHNNKDFEQKLSKQISLNRRKILDDEPVLILHSE